MEEVTGGLGPPPCEIVEVTGGLDPPPCEMEEVTGGLSPGSGSGLGGRVGSKSQVLSASFWRGLKFCLVGLKSGILGTSERAQRAIF